MSLYILINIISVNGLLPDISKPLPEPVLTYFLLVFNQYNSVKFKYKKCWPFCSGLNELSEQQLFPGTNELKG